MRQNILNWNCFLECFQAVIALVAASHAYARLRQLRGKVRFTRTFAELKADR
jgi:hypothetical protein